MRVILLLLALVALISAEKILMEVTFDLALQQESPTGYTASHTVGDYLSDPNLMWLRYFHTLMSGQPGSAPMRVAYLEFKDLKSWTTFESTNLERTHVLFDLFWINWRRIVWSESNDSNAVAAKPKPEGVNGGYMFTFRYGLKEGKEAAHSQWAQAALGVFATQLESNEGYFERHAYTSGVFSDQYQFMEMWEFKDMESLSKSCFENEAIRKVFDELNSLSSGYGSTVLVPSADQQGGQVFKGAGLDA